ncbi:Putative negative regulator of RcsB-dependent stress response [Filimonas lacunae]|uniref:Putative negative regulator of RcsB-dependent stress response n=1 Tax=Filimonas lacunae TaxID=477680 RepID=A0A173MKT1_9BACT|nr:tetratricopeptide repeat protein [Filimonas lacunae]BAV08087.1 TPR domain protein [Filimonas lacunae]SIT09126.1 Putative negative regulator of RcsB-dependent stress response [Filimonas lacunae]
MSEKHAPEVLETNDTLLRAQGFWQKNSKVIIGAVVAVVVIVGGYFGYQNFVVKPKEEKAGEAIYKAQHYFAIDSFKLALEGDKAAGAKGFLDIAKSFSGTKAGNLAAYYAGICHLRLGEFDKAVKQLKDFSTDAPQIQLVAYGTLGDAYSELGKKSEAIDAYKKAAVTFEKDETSSSEYLFRAALLSEINGNSKEALELYKQLKEKFPRTDKGFQADKYIYRLSVEKNDFSVK